MFFWHTSWNFEFILIPHGGYKTNCKSDKSLRLIFHFSQKIIAKNIYIYIFHFFIPNIFIFSRINQFLPYEMPIKTPQGLCQTEPWCLTWLNASHWPGIFLMWCGSVCPLQLHFQIKIRQRRKLSLRECFGQIRVRWFDFY